jgi:hypothetical protein
MSRVRIEIYPDDENFDEVQYAEAQYPDVREAFDRAVAMARVALPEKPLRQPCGQRCADPGGDCTDTCAKPAGHDDWHVTADEACSWGASEKEKPPEKRACGMYCDKSDPDCWGRCDRPADHGGDCYCSPDHNESLCLNEIGAPSQTRNCQQPIGHEGECGDA